MRKIILISIAIIGLAISYNPVHAQTAMTLPNGLSLDTASQAAAEGATIQVKNFASTISIELPVTKISGTIAGSVKWQGSNDNTKWFTIQTDTLTDATNVYGYSEAPKKWLYYKALITQTGTSSLSYAPIMYSTKSACGN